MADDLQITPLPPSSPQTSGASQSQQNGSGVIDLRDLDQQGSTGIAAQSSAQGSSSTSGVVTPIIANQKSEPASSKKAIALGDDDSGFVLIGNQKYAIPQLVKDKFPDLVQLIQETESMNTEEREYWFQILPIMTEDQIKKFRDILLNEKDQLTRLDKEYEQELTKLNEKHMVEWKEFETKEKRKALTQAEAQTQVQEQSLEEDLLKRLSQV